MSTVLVTGGSGFLGSWVVDHLLSSGDTVRVFDRAISPQTLDAVRAGNATKVTSITGDITDMRAVADAAAGSDAIIHLAGILTAACRSNPVLATQINVAGAINIFETARIHGIRKLAYVSSAGVFGPDNGQTPWPTTIYGAHKLAVEGFARAYFADHRLAATGFRPYIVYGPGEGSGISAGPSTACRAAVQGQAFNIKFTGTVGFVHVQDVAAAFAAAIADERASAEVFNLCGETASVARFIEILSRQIPAASITCSGPTMPISPKLTAENPPAWLSDLGITELENGIAATIEHLRSRNYCDP